MRAMAVLQGAAEVRMRGQRGHSVEHVLTMFLDLRGYMGP